MFSRSDRRARKGGAYRKKVNINQGFNYKGLIEYALALGYEMPSIRTSSPNELALMINARRPKKSYGGMSEDQAKMLTDMINENPEAYV